MTQLIFAQRKFSLAIFFSLVITIALFTGYMDGETFSVSLGIILGLYGAGNIGQRWVDRPPPNYGDIER